MSELTAALLEVQKEAPAIQKDGNNPHYNSDYVRLPALLDVLRPMLNERGVLLMQQPVAGYENTPMLLTRFTHVESGETEEFVTPLILDRDNSQGLGSAITYACRYALMAAFALSATSEDDDGEAASESSDSSGESGQTTRSGRF